MKLKLIIGLSIFLLALSAQAQDEPKKYFDTLTVYWENDTFFGTDRDYTNGLKLTWSTPYLQDPSASHLPEWSHAVINSLPLANNPEQQRAVSVSIGQDIYTPENTESRDLIADDRPYAGFTYLAVGFHSKNAGRKDTWEITLGVIGPYSYAQEMQDVVHDVIGSARAKGWDHQLDDEIGLNITFESQWRLLHTEIGRGFSCDLIPHIGGSVGNVSIYANAGAEARFGWNLPSNFGTCPIRAGCETASAFIAEKGSENLQKNRFGVHLFVATDGRAVLRDIFLDGNTFTDSHSVDKETFTGDLMAGISLEYGNIKASYSYTYRTKQFKTQDKDQIFGAVSVSYSY
jgi:hypothetical protein